MILLWRRRRCRRSFLAGVEQHDNGNTNIAGRPTLQRAYDPPASRRRLVDPRAVPPAQYGLELPCDFISRPQRFAARRGRTHRL